VNDKEVSAPDVRLTPENVEDLPRPVEEEMQPPRRQPDRSKDERGRQRSDEVGLRAREQAVADNDGMSQAD
jgi:hypothetical protein